MSPRSESPVDGARGAAHRLPWLLAACGFAFDLAAAWPGRMSFDSAYAWWQARGGEMLDVVPPGFTLAWRATLVFVDGPQAMFALQLGLFWSGLALLAQALAASRARVIALIGCAGAAPLVVLLRGQVWTDVAVLSALTCASGLLAFAHARDRRGFAWCALFVLLYAGAMRHNALPALIPFALWWARLVAGAGRVRLVACALAVLVASLGIGHLLARAAVRHIPLWPVTAQHDLAALSIADGRMHLPPFMTGPGLDVAELAGAFRFWSPLPLLTGTRHGVRSPLDPPLSEAELASLRTAWLETVRANPAHWLAHRARLAGALFGTHAADWPAELVYAEGEYAYRDNPPLAANDGATARALMRWAHTHVATAWLAAWPYLLAGLCALPFAWCRRRRVDGFAATILLASGWLYALPLLVAASSAETRYLAWPCIASVLALGLAIRFRAATAWT